MVLCGQAEYVHVCLTVLCGQAVNFLVHPLIYIYIYIYIYICTYNHNADVLIKRLTRSLYMK